MFNFIKPFPENKRKFGLYNLIIFTLPINYGIDMGFTLKPYLIISIPLIFGYFSELSLLKKEKGKAIVDRTLLFILIYFLSFMFVSIGVNGYPIKSIRHFVLLIWGIVIVYIYYKKTNNLEKIQKYIDTFVFAGFLLGISGVFMYTLYLIKGSLWGVYISPYYDYIRLKGAANDPNAHALVLMPYIAVSISSYFGYKHNHNNKALFTGFVSLLLIINLALTVSRGGYIALIYMLINQWMLLSPKKSNFFNTITKKTLIVILCVMFFIISFYLLDSLRTGIFNIKGALFRNRAPFETSRLEEWLASLEVFKSNLFWGVGQGLIRYHLYPIIGRELQSHNAYIELLAENGIFTGIFFLFLVCLLLKRSFSLIRTIDRNRHYYNFIGVFSGFLGILGMMVSLSILTSFILWFQMGLLLICLNVISKNIKSDKSKLKIPPKLIEILKFKVPKTGTDVG